MIEFGDDRMPTRFWSKIAIDTEAGCWSWTACIGAGSYARYGVAHSQSRYAHCVSYEAFVGPIPEGMNLDHTCHTNDSSCAGGLGCKHRRCVNPEHLEPVTPKENSLRGLGMGAIHAAKTHCINGHEFTKENTRPRAHGRGRVCRKCSSEDYYRRKKARGQSLSIPTTIVPGWDEEKDNKN